ncbi:uncharacterized protein LOC132546620 [Ylistrum balloti]|uniref:uncharacterized protein LOC132546620 n=1 Tax=Ylistrum balloti TaxID=509963 RepID=UPI002905A6E5|nr:uncharacterized protein LOC132546620 [Ylistrum balloti]
MKKPSNSKDSRNKSACPRGKRKLEYNDNKQPKLPLAGKLIYLDVKDVRLTKKLETDLKRLGSSVEKFFVKEINYLITSHPRPKQKNEDKLQSADSPAGVSTPSPFNCGPSPSPGAVETKAPQSVTRGKAILQKAQLQKKTSSIIENAEKWKVKIVSVEAALKWILKELAKLPPDSSKGNQSEKTRGCKVKRLQSPMLKFESNTKQYRPIHGSLANWPFANVDTPKGTCPFDGTTVGRGERSREERGDRIGLAQPMDNNMPASPAGMAGEDMNTGSNKTPRVEPPGKSRPSENQAGGPSGIKVATAGELRRRKEQKRIQERKKGYCECCQVKYDDLDKHVFQEQHRAFIRDKKNYDNLDHLILTGPSTARFLQRVLLRHCTKQHTADTNISESDEEVVLITPGKSAAKAAAKDKKGLQPPEKCQRNIAAMDCSSQELNECREKRKSPRNSKTKLPEGPASLSKSDQKMLKDKPEKNKSKGDTNKSVKEEEECVLKDKESKNKSIGVSPKVSFHSAKHSHHIVPDLAKSSKKIDCSPEKRSCTSDGLDLKNHVVPVRTKNCHGVYPNMSPSRVSWARRHSISADEYFPSKSAKLDKPACARVLDSSNVAKKNINEDIQMQERQISKGQNSKLSDIDIPLPGDQIRVLRETRSRSKQGQMSSQTQESSPRVSQNTENTTKLKYDEVDGDSPLLTFSRKATSLVELQISPIKPHFKSTVKSMDTQSSPRKGRLSRSLTKTVAAVESENKNSASNIQEKCNYSQDTATIGSASPSKDTKCKPKLHCSQIVESVTSRTRSQSPLKDKNWQSKAMIDSSQTMDSAITCTVSRSPVKDTNCHIKAKCEQSQIKVSVTARTRSHSPFRDTICEDEVKHNASQIKDSTISKLKSQSLEQEISPEKINPGKIDNSTSARTRSPGKKRKISRSKVKCDDTNEGASIDINTKLQSPEKQKITDEKSVKLLNSPRTRSKMTTPNEEKCHDNSLHSVNVNCTIGRQAKNHSIFEKNISVDTEPVSPRKRLRKGESDSAKLSAAMMSTSAKLDCTSPSLKNSKLKLKTSIGVRMDQKQKNGDTKTDSKSEQDKIESSTKNKSLADLAAVNTDPVMCPAVLAESMEEGFYINCMEMVKKRSQMRREAQKLRSVESPLSSSSVASRLDGTPRKRITVTLSPCKSGKSASSDGQQRQNIRSDTNVQPNTTVNSPGEIQGQIKSVNKTTLLSATNTQSAKIFGVKKKSELHISSGRHTPGQGDNQNVAQSSKGSEVRRQQRALDKARECQEMERSPSPLFNRSPKYNKSRKSFEKDLRKTSKSRAKKSVVYDPYDIGNLSPLKPEQVVLNSPRSGYSGETSRSKKKNRNWRPPQKHSSERKSSSTKKLQKLKLPDPTSSQGEDLETKKLNVLVSDSDVNEKNSSKGKMTSINSFEHRQEVSKDQLSSMQRKRARHKLELNSNCKQGKNMSSVVSAEKIPVQKQSGHADSGEGTFIAIKKLELCDQTFMEHKDEELLSQKEKRSCGTKPSQKVTGSSSKHRKRKDSFSDSKVGSSKDKSDKGHSKIGEGSLKFQIATGETSPKARTVKLNKSWSLLSDRSMAKMLQSEEEDNSFEGFQPEHATGGTLLGSEMSYVETTEVELEGNSDHEWLLDHDQEDEGEEEENLKNKNDFINFVNCTFTSPGKHTDSSWDETFDNYIDIQLNRSKPSGANNSFDIVPENCSPRIFGSPRRRQTGLTPNKRKSDFAELSDLPKEYVEYNHTPKRRKFHKRKAAHDVEEPYVEQVDEDIEFNYCSPQKLKEVYSPRHKLGTEIVLSSSPLKCRGSLFTSTPHSVRQKKVGCLSTDLPALSGNDNTVETKSSNHKSKSTRELSSQSNVNTDGSKQSGRSSKRHK